MELYLLILVWCVNMVAASNYTVDWEKFKDHYNKSYNNKSDEKHHFQSFVKNLEEIGSHNKLYETGLRTYKKGITKYADLTADEFIEIYGLDQGEVTVYDSAKNATGNATEYLDWREKGAVTRVKDQGECGACWIFSAVAVLEGFHYRKTKKLVSLSEQNMVDCISNKTCGGGWTPMVFIHLSGIGNTISKEESYPYKGSHNGKCQYEKSAGVKVNFKGFGTFESDEEELKEALAKYGPMVVSLGVDDNWKLYKGGVWYEKECSDYLNHSMTLVGYGTENGSDYWLIKNSWGKDWGENGYIKFARNKHDYYCGLTQYMYYLE